MGWSFAYDPRHDRAAVIAEQTRGWSGETETAFYTVQCLKHSARGGTLWAVFERTETAKDGGAVTKSRFIACILIKSGGRGYGWGCKQMCESMGPSYYDCPLSFLEMVPEPDSEYCKGWRDQVREYHAKQRKAPKPGAVIKLANPLKFRDGKERSTFTIEQIPHRGKMRTVFRDLDGMLCRVPGWKSMKYEVIAA